MSKVNKKIPQRTFLTRMIQQVMVMSYCPGMVLLGVSCLFSSMASAESVVVSNPDTNIADQTEQKIEDKQQQKIATAVKEQQQQLDAQQQQTLDQSVKQFQADAVYQLKESDVPQANQAMLEEINQIAAQAQQEARQQEAQIPAVNQVIQAQKTDHLDVATDSGTAQQNHVDQFMQQLQQDQLPTPEQSTHAKEVLDPTKTSTTPAKKRGFFAKLFRRGDDLSDQGQSLPKINVTVTGATGNLADNIKAKLSTFTIESFEDFNVALPQLKSQTTQAAQAVGYYQAEFKFYKRDEKSLLIDVEPHQPVKVNSQSIEFSGAGARRPAFQVIKVVPDLNDGDVLNHGQYETTKTRINTAASDLGYFDGYWRMHDVKVTLPENTADIALKYETGERYQLKGVEFRMMDPKKPFPLRRSVLEKLVPFKEGDDYTSWRINLLSNNLVNSRYFNFALVDVTKPDPIEKPLELPEDVKALVEQDPELKAEKNKIDTADEVTSQKVVDENLFAGTEENKSQQIAADTTASQTKTENETDQLKQKARDEKKIPVVVYLNADNLNNLETGIGYGTDTGVRLRTQYLRSIVNDRGHSFDANFELSQVKQSLDGRYIIPYKDPLNDYISLIGGYEREVLGDVGQGIKLNTESAVVGIEHSVKKAAGEWQRTSSLRYRLDRLTTEGDVDTDDIPDAFKIVGSSPEQQSLLAGYEVSRTDADNAVNPTKGFRQFYRLEAGSKSLLTETDLAILNMGWRFIYSLGENADHQFIGRADLGYIFTKDFDQVPYNLRYFAGGDQSIRGFDYKSLSPIDSGLLVGGQALAVASMEYNYQFKEGWRAAVFVDVGNAYDAKFSTDTKVGTGVGIRWASPVGPIRVDVAAGVSEESIPIRLHFFIGAPL